jgi:isoleucyl-tRNA synthetase
MFKPVTSKINFPQLEEQILSFWRERDIFPRSVEERKGGTPFILYEGPPTTNGSPGIHHVLTRVFKDVLPRYKAMKGYYAPRRAGWDTHGLPVELEVEKELGLSTKSQIEEYGIEQFNARCRESILRYLGDWEKLTERIGFWLDLRHPYITYDPGYIESCWWVIRQLWDRGLVYQGYKVTPHCPRCGTSLSSHEVALGYREDAEDPSLYVKFRLLSPLPDASPSSPTFLLAWTTTPWTLPGNVALAVSPDARYALIELVSDSWGGKAGERLLLAQSLLRQAIPQEYKLITVIPGSELEGLQYEPLYDPYAAGVPVQRFERDAQGKVQLIPSTTPPERLTYPVIPGDFVSLDEGTGIVHIAPAFGEVDYEAGEREGLLFVQPVDLRGYIGDPRGAWSFGGRFVKQADPLIIADLKSRGLLYRSETIKHTYPFCWRCDMPLLYYAKKSWYIRTTAVKERLIAGNAEVNWYPSYIKYGRFGDWLENNVDWALSRERYWGTPLNIWQCESCPDQIECVGSLEELRNKPGLEGWREPFDPHRPFVDQVTYTCPQCGGRMRRVPEVLDAWFDSGAMPVAQWHYPFENREQFQQSFPADYICEAVDQTRGWFYTLHALSTLLFDRPCFKNVICVGHILDAKGEKMSKARGNVIDPWTVLNQQGADALRWYLLTSAPPGNARRFSIEGVTEVLRRFLLTLWNTYSFFVTYANIDRFDPRSAPPPAYRSDLDRWILSELNQLVAEVSERLEDYDPTTAARRIEDFVDGLSNWYVRRSRRRFWKSESDADKLAAYFTLYHCLVTLSRLLAPLAPFLAEELHQNLVRSVYPEAPESVHLCDFPVADAAQIDPGLTADTRLVMKICSLGRAARSKAGIKVRQPLTRVRVKTRSKLEREGLQRLAYQVLDELNVKEMEFLEHRAEVQDKPEYAVAAEGDYLVAILTHIPPELRDEGRAREIVHRLQTMRRNAGFDIADYIVTFYQADPPLRQVMQNFASYIRQETLSTRLVEGTPEEGAYTQSYRIDGHQIVLGVKRQA